MCDSLVQPKKYKEIKLFSSKKHLVLKFDQHRYSLHRERLILIWYAIFISQTHTQTDTHTHTIVDAGVAFTSAEISVGMAN